MNYEEVLDELTDEPYLTYCGLQSPKDKLRSYIIKLEKEREVLIEELIENVCGDDTSPILRMHVRRKVELKLKKKLESDDK